MNNKGEYTQKYWMDMIGVLQDVIAEDRKLIEKLKCCGNCNHLIIGDVSDDCKQDCVDKNKWKLEE